VRLRKGQDTSRAHVSEKGCNVNQPVTGIGLKQALRKGRSGDIPFVRSVDSCQDKLVDVRTPNKMVLLAFGRHHSANISASGLPVDPKWPRETPANCR